MNNTTALHKHKNTLCTLDTVGTDDTKINGEALAHSLLYISRILKGIQNALSFPVVKQAQGKPCRAAKMGCLFYELGSLQKTVYICIQYVKDALGRLIHF